MRLWRFGRPWLRIKVGTRLKSLGMIMVNSMWIKIFNSYVRNVASKCNIWTPKDPSKMVWKRGKIGISRRWLHAWLRVRIWVLRDAMNPLIVLHIFKTYIYTNHWKGKHLMSIDLVTNLISHLSWFLAQGNGLEFHQKRGRHCSHKEKNASW